MSQIFQRPRRFKQCQLERCGQIYYSIWVVQKKHLRKEKAREGFKDSIERKILRKQA